MFTSPPPPHQHKILSRTEVKLLESGGPKASGFVRGIDTASEREAARRAARAKRFASSMVNDTVIRERHAGRTAADKELDEMARKRAARFGIAVLVREQTTTECCHQPMLTSFPLWLRHSLTKPRLSVLLRH